MKNLIFVFILIISFTKCYSQEFRFGIKGGFNFSTLNGSDASNLDSRFNYHAGVSFRIGLTDILALQPEIIYSSQGFTNNVEGLDIDGQLDYINVPILLDYTIAENFSLQAGPQIGINTVDEAKPDNLAQMDLGAESVDISVLIGAQYITAFNIYVQARYGLGITEVVKGLNGKNSVVSLSLGYLFN